MNNPGNIDFWSFKINNSWRKSLDAVLATAALCAQAQSQLHSADRRRLLAALAFDPSTFSKLVKIGNCSRLSHEDLRGQLPSAYSILYDISLLTDTELERALRDNVISPQMSRAELVQWKRENMPNAQKEAPRILGQVKLTKEISDDDEAKLLEELVAVAERRNAVFVERLDPAEVAGRRADTRIMNYMRKHAKHFIREKGAAAIKRTSRPHVGGKKRDWGYAPEEVEITTNTTEAELEDIFKFIGEEDQFARIRDEAMRVFDDDLAKAFNMRQARQTLAEQPGQCREESGSSLPDDQWVPPLGEQHIEAQFREPKGD